MSGPDEAVFARYRSTLADRVGRVLQLVGQEGTELDGPEVRREVLGELHTLKGEARMLGLSALATLAHALEEETMSPEGDIDVLVSVLDSLVLALAEGTPADLRDDLVATGLHALGKEMEANSPPGEEGKASPLECERRTSETWIQVSAKTVQDLTELLASVSAEIARSGAPSPNNRGDRFLGNQISDRVRDCLSLALGLRLVPLSQELSRLESHSRRLARERGTSLEVRVRAGGVQVERRVLDSLRDPLVHLVNNAMEHGLRDLSRPGRLDLVAENIGACVVVHIEDNGHGIDGDEVLARAQALGLRELGSREPGSRVSGLRTQGLSRNEIHELLFEPGFSTRSEADEGAGRGIGLDVVRRHVQAAGGTIEIHDVPTGGTRFTLTVPAPMSQGRFLVVRIGEMTCALPTEWVEGIASNDPAAHEGRHFRWEGRLRPRTSLAELLRVTPQEEEGKVLAICLGDQRVALTLERVIDQLELLRRPTHPTLARHFGIAATAVLRDGTIAYVLDPDFLIRQLKSNRRTIPNQEKRTDMKPRVLVVDDSPIVLDLVREVLGASGFDVRTAPNGREALSAFREFSPHVVLTDIEMPHMDGFAFLRELRKLSDTVPVLVLSAKRSSEDRKRASDLGASAYVVKSEFEGAALVGLVSRYCARNPP